MRSIARQFAVVFFIGFIALAAALAFGSATGGSFLDPQPFLVALRSFGLGWMAAGMALWVALRRDEGGSAELNPLLGLLIGLGCAFLVITLFLAFDSVAVDLIGGGLGLTFAALLIGVLAMVFRPAYPKPVTVRWPGGEEARTTPAPAADSLQRPNTHTGGPDDLTRIEGVGPRVQEILSQAGLATFVEVARCSPEQLRQILKEAHFRGSANPGTWPQQAELAAKGDWDGLARLQKQLTAGRSEKKPTVPEKS